MIFIHAGAMRDRVTLQAKTLARDEVGGVAETYTDLATVSADVNPLHGRELDEAGKQQAETMIEISIRYRAGVVSTMRVLHLDTGKLYDIRSVIDVNSRRHQMVLTCRERD